MRVEKLTSHIGAELHGVDLAEAARNDDLFGAIKRSAARRTRCCSCATRRSAGPTMSPSPTGSASSRIIRSSAAIPTIRAWSASTRTSIRRPTIIENAWHCDATWREMPADGRRAALHRRSRRSAATRSWANMAKAYEDLPDHMKETIDGLYARHSIEASFGARMPIEKRHALKAQYPDAEHPVVRTHPETGEKVLFVNGYRDALHQFPHAGKRPLRPGLSRPAARTCSHYLIGRAAIPEYQVRWRWKPNSVAIWDNRCTQHYAVMDYWPAVRKMERAGIIGDRPY